MNELPVQRPLCFPLHLQRLLGSPGATNKPVDSARNLNRSSLRSSRGCAVYGCDYDRRYSQRQIKLGATTEYRATFEGMSLKRFVGSSVTLSDERIGRLSKDDDDGYENATKQWL